MCRVDGFPAVSAADDSIRRKKRRPHRVPTVHSMQFHHAAHAGMVHEAPRQLACWSKVACSSAGASEWCRLSRWRCRTRLRSLGVSSCLARGGRTPAGDRRGRIEQACARPPPHPIHGSPGRSGWAPHRRFAPPLRADASKQRAEPFGSPRQYSQQFPARCRIRLRRAASIRSGLRATRGL